MRPAVVLLLGALLAGCAAAPVEPAPEATKAPVPETWYFDVTADPSTPRILTQDKPDETSASGEALPTVGPQRLGPYVADAPTGGFPAGTPALATLPLECRHPAEVHVKVELLANGTLVGQGETLVSHPGAPPGLPMVVDAAVAFNLTAEAPAGSGLAAYLTYDGCAMLLVGRGGDWARRVDLGQRP